MACRSCKPVVRDSRIRVPAQVGLQVQPIAYIALALLPGLVYLIAMGLFAVFVLSGGM
jgi:hypothetical protein